VPRAQESHGTGSAVVRDAESVLKELSLDSQRPLREAIPDAVDLLVDWFMLPTFDKEPRLTLGLAVERFACDRSSGQEPRASITEAQLFSEGAIRDASDATETAVQDAQQLFRRAVEFCDRALRHGWPDPPDTVGPASTVWFTRWRTGEQRLACLDAGRTWPDLLKWPKCPSQADLAAVLVLWRCAHRPAVELDVATVASDVFSGFWDAADTETVRSAALLPIDSLAATASRSRSEDLFVWVEEAREFAREPRNPAVTEALQAGVRAALEDLSRHLKVFGAGARDVGGQGVASLLADQRSIPRPSLGRPPWEPAWGQPRQ
jgi:hypothetical protein